MSLPAIDPAVVVADFDTDFVVLVPDRRRAHHLGPLWAVVFDSCRTGQTRAELVDDICTATEWDRATTERWVDEAVDAFVDSGIVTS